MRPRKDSIPRRNERGAAGGGGGRREDVDAYSRRPELSGRARERPVESSTDVRPTPDESRDSRNGRSRQESLHSSRVYPPSSHYDRHAEPSYYNASYGNTHNSPSHGNTYNSSSYGNTYNSSSYGNTYNSPSHGNAHNSSSYGNTHNSPSYGNTNYGPPASNYGRAPRYQSSSSSSYGNYTSSDYRSRSGRDRFRSGHHRSHTYNRGHEQSALTSLNTHSDHVRHEPRLDRAQAINRLAQLEGVLPLAKITVIASRWGVRPKGFDNVSAQRAKLSGLFPLPGHPRPVDMTKLEGLLKGDNDILIDKSHIDPRDSRVARTLILSGVDFALIDYLKVVQYWDDFLRHVDYGSASTDDNVTAKRKTRDNRHLIIELKTRELATLVYCLRDTVLSIDLFMKDDVVRVDTATEFKLVMERPQEYVVEQAIAGQIAVKVSIDMDEKELGEIVEATIPKAQVQIIREIGTRKSLGLGLVSTGSDPDPNSLQALQSHERVQDAFFSVGPAASTQSCSVDYTSLPKMARSEQVSIHPRLRVAVLLNILSIKELIDDAAFHFIHEDISTEAAKYGKLISVKIPRPAHNYCPGLQQFAEPGLGKVFLKFEEEGMAVRAIMELAGRLYNDRTVLCSFYSERDYDLGLF